MQRIKAARALSARAFNFSIVSCLKNSLQQCSEYKVKIFNLGDYIVVDKLVGGNGIHDCIQVSVIEARWSAPHKQKSISNVFIWVASSNNDLGKKGNTVRLVLLIAS